MEKEPQLDINSEKEKIAKQIERFRYFKNEWKSEIPNQILSGASPDKKYKVRKNWFQGVIGDLEWGVLPLLSKEKHQVLIEDIRNFFSRYTSAEFKSRLTTKEDIDTADSLIDSVISVLENLQNSI